MAKRWSAERRKRRVVVEMPMQTFEAMVADMTKRGIEEITAYIDMAVLQTAATPMQGEVAA